jgi:hypothetical protein
MNHITEYVLDRFECHLNHAHYDNELRREILEEAGVNMVLYVEEGITEIDDSRLIDFICSRFLPILPLTDGFLEALCNDIDWSAVQKFMSDALDELFISTEGPPAKKPRYL